MISFGNSVSNQWRTLARKVSISGLKERSMMTLRVCPPKG
jgi:hypothetical protein